MKRPQNTNRTNRANALLISSAVVLLASMIASLSLGRYGIPMREIVHILATTRPWNAVEYATNVPWVVIEIVRVPRVLLVTLCGMGLALSGAAMQGVFRNPLVGPEIAGVSSGAACGGVLAIMLALPSLGVVALALAGGIAALVIALGMARAAGRSGMLVLVLSGVIVGAFFSAVVGVLETLADPVAKLPSIVYWLLGSFAGATYQKLSVIATVLLIAGTLLLMLRWRINLLSLGEDDAEALHANAGRVRWAIIFLVAMIVAAQVAVSGGVGWVGLIIPHIARMMIGPEHSKLLPVSACLGGVYLLAMDDIARSVGTQEIPIGLLTAMVGAPIFGYLFWRTQGRGWRRE